MNTSHKSVDSLNGNHFERRPQRVNVSPKWKQRRLTFNVGGTRFETYNTTLLRFPGTRLARLAKSGEADEAYDAAAGEFFFDRSPAVFALVLEYYRTGELHVDGDSCGNRVHAELDFWKLDETDIEECCWSKYTHATDTRESLAQIDRVLRAHCDYSDAWVRAATNPLLRARRYLWRAFEDPSASLFAKLLFAVSTITILLSVGFIFQSSIYSVWDWYWDVISSIHHSFYSYSRVSVQLLIVHLYDCKNCAALAGGGVHAGDAPLVSGGQRAPPN